MGALRPDDRLAVADDGVGELREEERPGRDRPAALGGVVPVVEPDADDLARDRERRDELDVVERDAGRAVERRGPAAEVVEGLRVEVDPGQEAVEDRDHAVADEDRRAAVLITEVRDEAHRRSLGQLGRRGGAGRGRRCRSGPGWRVDALGVALGVRGPGRRLRLCSGSRSGHGALLLRVGPLAPLLVEGQDLGLVERVERQDAAPDDRLERRRHLVEPGDDRADLALWRAADRAGGKVS